MNRIMNMKRIMNKNRIMNMKGIINMFTEHPTWIRLEKRCKLRLSNIVGEGSQTILINPKIILKRINVAPIFTF